MGIFKNRPQTFNAGWQEVDPSGNKQNQKTAREASKWVEMTKAELEQYKKDGGRTYGIRNDGSKFQVKVEK